MPSRQFNERSITTTHQKSPGSNKAKMTTTTTTTTTIIISRRRRRSRSSASSSSFFSALVVVVAVFFLLLLLLLLLIIATKTIGKKVTTQLTMFSKTSKPDDNVRPVDDAPPPPPPPPPPPSKNRKERIQRRVKQFRALSPLSQLLSCIFLALYAMDFSTTWNDALCLHLTLLGALARPWTLVTCQLVSPTVLEIPAIVGLVFLVEILLKRAYVGSRVVCELLLTTAVVTGGLYVLFGAFHRTVISGEEAGTPLALGPHSLVGGALVLCQKLKNDLSDEDTVRRRRGTARVVSSRRRVYRRRDR